MDPETTYPNLTTLPQHLYMALELSQTTWQLGFTIGLSQAPNLRKLAACDLPGLLEDIRLSRQGFGLPENVPILSRDEGGRDGFWLHRYLTCQGVTNLVVESASIEVQPARIFYEVSGLPPARIEACARGICLPRFLKASERCLVSHHSVASLSQAVQDFYNGPSAAIDFKDISHEKKMIELIHALVQFQTGG